VVFVVDAFILYFMIDLVKKYSMKKEKVACILYMCM
jgi:hypothetical protein